MNSEAKTPSKTTPEQRAKPQLKLITPNTPLESGGLTGVWDEVREDKEAMDAIDFEEWSRTSNIRSHQQPLSPIIEEESKASSPVKDSHDKSNPAVVASVSKST